MADWGNALTNFGAGALGGYRDVLGMKMKEDAIAKRDEAMAERQANLEKLRFEREEPGKNIEREQKWTDLGQTKDYRDKSISLQEKQIQQQAADRAASRGDAAAGRAEQARHNRVMEKASSPEEKIRGQKLIDEYEAQGISNFAKKEAQRVLENGGTQKDADTVAATMEGLGVKSRKEYTAATANTDFMKTVNNVREESVKSAEKQLAAWTEMGKDGDIMKIKAVTQMGWKPEMGDTDTFFMRKKITSAVSSLSPLTESPKSASKASAAGTPDLSRPLTGDQLRQTAIGFLSGDEDTKALVDKYREVNPDIYKRIMNVSKTVQKEQDIADQKGLLKLNQYETW